MMGNQNKKNNKIILRNTIFMAIRMVLLLGISLYTSRVVLQVLGVEDYGIYNVVAGFVSMFAFLNSSMTNANQRFYNIELGKDSDTGVNVVYNTSLRIQVFLAIAVLLLTETVGLWYLYDKMVIPPDRLDAAFWVFQFSVISLLFIIFQIPYSAAIIAYERMDYYAYVGIIDAFLKLFIALSIPYAKGDQLIVYGFLLLTINIINWCLYFFYAKLRFKVLSFHKKFNFDLFKNMLGFSAWNCFGIFSTVFREQGANMLLNLFFGPVINAARAIAYQVSGALESFVLNITTASRPQMIQTYAKGERERMFHIMYSVSKLCFLFVLCIALPIIIEVDFVLKIWLGDTIPEHTNSFMVLVVIAALIRVFHPMTSHIVHATGKMSVFQVTNGILNLLLIPIVYVMLRLGYSPESIFVLFIIMNMVIQYVSWIILRRLVPEFSIASYIRQVIIPLCIISALAVILPYVAHIEMDSGFLRFFIVTLLSVVSIITLGFLIALNHSEKRTIVGYLEKIRKR